MLDCQGGNTKRTTVSFFSFLSKMSDYPIGYPKEIRLPIYDGSIKRIGMRIIPVRYVQCSILKVGDTFLEQKLDDMGLDVIYSRTVYRKGWKYLYTDPVSKNPCYRYRTQKFVPQNDDTRPGRNDILIWGEGADPLNVGAPYCPICYSGPSICSCPLYNGKAVTREFAMRLLTNQ